MTLEELKMKVECRQVLCSVVFRRNNTYIDSNMFICDNKSIFNHIRDILNFDIPEELVYYVDVEILDFNNNYKKESYELIDTDYFSNYSYYEFICA